MLHEDLTNKIIRCYYEVYNILVYRFLEKIYENAVAIKLKEQRDPLCAAGTGRCLV